MPRQARAEISGHAVRESTQADRLAFSGISDALEALRYPVETFRVGTQMVR
jgi:hypothetical protein